MERDITEHFVSSGKLIREDMERLIIADVCSNLQQPLLYFEKIKNKRGFQDEVRAFIKNLKRNCINLLKLQTVTDNIGDPILADKLLDLKVLFESYDSILQDKGLYDINDISLMAIEKAKESGILENLDSIFIDGFINIDKVNMELIRTIGEESKVNLYVNCPYRNENSITFISKEILMPFKNMAFEIHQEAYEEIETDEQIRELSLKFYSGEKAIESLDRIHVTEYPCIQEEVRATARAIKQQLMDGEDPEEIAVYVNNLMDYSETITRVFKEFGLRAAIKEELPLSESAVIRKAIAHIEKEDTVIKNAYDLI